MLVCVCVCVSLFLPLKTAAEMKVVKRWRRNIHLALSPTIPVCFRPIASSPSLYLSPSAPLSLCLQGKSCSLSNYLCDSLLACVCVCGACNRKKTDSSSLQVNIADLIAMHYLSLLLLLFFAYPFAVTDPRNERDQALASMSVAHSKRGNQYEGKQKSE